MNKICPECGERFSGRSDKRFCCDSCRSNNYRRTAYPRFLAAKPVMADLMRNYRILQGLASDNVSRGSRRRMTAQGFDFELFTSSRRRGLGGRTYFCFDISYRIAGDRVIIGNK